MTNQDPAVSPRQYKRVQGPSDLARNNRIAEKLSGSTGVRVTSHEQPVQMRVWSSCIHRCTITHNWIVRPTRCPTHTYTNIHSVHTHPLIQTRLTTALTLTSTPKRSPLGILEIFRWIEIRRQVKSKKIIVYRIPLCFLFRIKSYYWTQPHPTLIREFLGFLDILGTRGTEFSEKSKISSSRKFLSKNFTKVFFHQLHTHFTSSKTMQQFSSFL